MEDAKVESVDSTMDIANVVAGLAVKSTTKVVPAISPVRTIVEMSSQLVIRGSSDQEEHPPADPRHSFCHSWLERKIFVCFSHFERSLGFCRLGEPQEALLKDPPLDQRLKHDLKILHGFEFPELKELLSKQTLFNVGLSRVSSEGKDLSPPKALGLRTLQKRKVDTTGGRSTRARVELLLAPPTSKIEEFNPHNIEDF
ncbi:hypothetical protein COCNU_04G007370 [Cocos nucifera]|uniref:Uncharacterized protein n=1 Tax=Cocos nucifera TaxID=13894 RepID=A0A8K0I5W6_COCNU|nr:hypothetical protein COCNU_04G007370 [Cocos nucifera]